MFADGLVAFLNDKNLIQHVPLIAQPFDPDESYLDEVVGYTVAALGARARSVARALQERCKSVARSAARALQERCKERCNSVARALQGALQERCRSVARA